eukprot:TRINITY_DN11481_c0_g1_i1.p1 TRINITY_DN11481_c0_g1~~TRINITY_DN11481_c0_g1_i1.p1  ORF type:complete len:545 (+),score=193.90 TRINITY_DN11481_c0_g1_i1:27-1637(+)
MEDPLPSPDRASSPVAEAVEPSSPVRDDEVGSSHTETTEEAASEQTTAPAPAGGDADDLEAMFADDGDNDEGQETRRRLKGKARAAPGEEDDDGAVNDNGEGGGEDQNNEFDDIFGAGDDEDVFAGYDGEAKDDLDDDLDTEHQLTSLVKTHKEGKKERRKKEGKDKDKEKEKKKSRRKSTGEGDDAEGSKKKKKRKTADEEKGKEKEKEKKKKRRSSTGDASATTERDVDAADEHLELGDVDDDEDEVAEGSKRSSSSRTKSGKEKDWFDQYLDTLKRPRSKQPDEKDIVEAAKSIVDKMELAAHEDLIIVNSKSNQPALNKVLLLKEVKTTLAKRTLWYELVEQGVLGTIKKWLDPLPDQSWPSLDIRTALLEALAWLPVNEEGLRDSGVGKSVMFYFKSDKETPTNRKAARSLIEKWSRPIFGLSSRYEELEEVERKGVRRSTTYSDKEMSELDKRVQDSLKNKERVHAAIPQRASMDFLHRPESRLPTAAVSNMARSSVAADRYIKKKLKGKPTSVSNMRAVKISVEGRAVK